MRSQSFALDAILYLILLPSSVPSHRDSLILFELMLVDFVGTPVEDVIAWMKDLSLKSQAQHCDQAFDSSFFSATLSSDSLEDHAGASTMRLLPLDTGSAVACAYLVHLVSAGEQSALLHNELGYLLLRDIKKAQACNDIKRVHIFRTQLCEFLKTSDNYESQPLLPWLPPDFLPEKALMLAHLQNHSAVLDVYALDLKDDGLAENYCSRIWCEAAQARDGRVIAQHVGADHDHPKQKVLSQSALDIYATLAHCYASRSPLRNEQLDAARESSLMTSLDDALSLMYRHLDRIHPVAVLSALPKDVSLARCVHFVKALIRFLESERRAALVEHNLQRVEFVNLKYELTQEQIKHQSKISAVPELTRLGRVICSLPPVVLSEDPEGLGPYHTTHPQHGQIDLYHVSCVRHIFESHIVLQFHVTNSAKGQQMQNIRVRVESLSDADLYVHDADVPLDTLPFESTGSCYVVFKTHPTIGIVTTLFSCELRFSVVAQLESNNFSTSGSYLEEIPLKNLELSTNASIP